MYRLMIADDEDDERAGIRFLLNRYGFEMEITEAVDGKDALEKLERQPVDILLTDVKMPFLDGIQLATRVQRMNPDTKLIFISGYDDFEYVRSALSLRAVDYILKPVSPRDFEKVISMVLGRIRQEGEESRHNSRFHKHYILSSMVNQIPLPRLEEKYGRERIRFLEEYDRLIMIEFGRTFFGQQVSDVHDFSLKMKQALATEFDFLDVNVSQGVFFLKNSGLTEDQAYALAEEIHRYLKNTYDISTYAAVGDVIAAPEEIGQQYVKAEKNLEERFFYKDCFIYPVRLQRQALAKKLDESTMWKEIEQNAASGDMEKLRSAVMRFIDGCRVEGGQSYIYIRFVCTNLLRILVQAMPDGEERLADLVEKSYRCVSFSELEDLIWNVVDELQSRLAPSQDSVGRMITMVEQYIQAHYKEPLSLDILAEKVYLTPHYLSSIFIRERGIGINKYIKMVRMKKAEELLRNTNRKISDICEQVGYTNLSYFCRSFRNEYGVTPEQYRK